VAWAGFQLPIRRGGLCNPGKALDRLEVVHLSAPYSSGRSLQQLPRQQRSLAGPAFSPLFVGAVSATSSQASVATIAPHFQPPIRRGGLCNLVFGEGLDLLFLLSAPYSSGRSLQPRNLPPPVPYPLTFSPLFVGAVSAT